MSNHESHQLAPCDEGPENRERRDLLKWATFLLGGLASTAAGVPILGYLLAPILPPRDKWVDLGELHRFPDHQTRLVDLENPLDDCPWDGVTAKLAIYVRRLEGNAFSIFSVHCTHLGCPVSWFEEPGLFMCPCHGGVYYEDGSHASGPPPRGLYKIPFKVRKEHLWVRLGHVPTLQNTLGDGFASGGPYL